MLQENVILVDRYRLCSKLGQMAGRQTWLAEDVSANPARQVIVKLLAFADQVNWETLKLFEREANILRQLHHPKIPRYVDYFSIEDRVLWFGLVQEYIPGMSLKDVLAQGKRFSETEVKDIAREILKILIYLHELSPPVFHRDLKPSNLILGRDRQIYLIDFGAVQDRAAVEGATFTVVGTYGYAPMEQFGGRTVPASDLYSLGATLIHLLTGAAPADLPQRNLHIQFSHLVSVNPKLVQWIETLTEPDVANRLSTARGALMALEAKSMPVPQPSTRGRDRKGGAIVLERPIYSRVKVYSSPQELVIRLPGQPVAAQLGGMAGLGLIVLGVFASAWFMFPFIPAFIFGIIIAVSSIYSGASTTAILNQAEFLVRREVPVPLLPWVERIGGCATDDIDAVIHHDLQFQNGKSTVARRVVTVQTSYGDISFCQGLTREECAWIAQEMNHWLKCQ